MEDKENLNNDDLLNSSMFGSSENVDETSSMFSEGTSMFDENADSSSLEQNETPPSMFDEEAKPAEEQIAEEIPQQAPEQKPEIKQEEKPIEEKSSQLDNSEEEETQPANESKEKQPLQVIEEDEADNDENENITDVVTVRPVKFKKFEATAPIRTIKKNLDIMQDVLMHISVELGRTKLSIKEVMDFEKGSIVELNKIAGEQVEIFVNGKIVAKGEVIVIEDRFGVRITSTNIPKNILSP